MPSDITTPGRVMLSEVLPEDMKDAVKTPMNKKGATVFFDQLARRYPDSYVDTMHKMTNLANQVSTEYGRWTSVKLSDLKLPPQTKAFRDMLKERVHAISQHPTWTSDQKSEKIVELVKSNIDKAKKLLEDEGVALNNSFAMSSKHGIRGNPTQLMQMLVGDMLVTDNSGKTIPLPILHGYAEGLSPLETWAGSYASRRGYCLDADTYVRMADGTCKAIKKILPGEQVLACDLEGNLFSAFVKESLDQGSKPVFQHVFSRTGGGSSITFCSTMEHKVFAHSNTSPVILPIRDITSEIRLRIVQGAGIDAVLDGSHLVGVRPTWDLSLDTEDHLFVLANGLVVSNSAVQFSTADTGYLAKQLRLMTTGTQVTADDCGTEEGLVMDPRSEDAAGRFVARGQTGLKPGTALTPEALKKVRQKEIVVRSPITCKLPNGVCQKCVGLRPDGKLPGINSFVSLDAATTISEPMTQKLALCLDPETEVRMADWSIKRLREVEIGDEVAGVDEQGMFIPVKVLSILVSDEDKDLYRFSYWMCDGNWTEASVVASADHKILSITNNGLEMRPAGEFLPVVFYNPSFESPCIIAGTPTAEEQEEDIKKIFVKKDIALDIEVDHPTHRFLLANGLIVSNSAKHVGGQVGSNEGDLEGFDEINQFVQVPENFKGAVVSEVDGTVKKVEDAPQGGKYVYVDDEQYHVPANKTLLVNKGQKVSAGDALTGGTINPAEVARYRGIGEGRRYFVATFGEILKRNGVPALPQNLELLARAYVKNVRVTAPDGVAGYRFGEVVPYEALQEHWRERPDSRTERVQYAAGKYLEQPAAHYTIGTRITPAVQQELNNRGIKTIIVHDQEPGFMPYVTRAASRSTHERDWKARMAGFYLKDAYEDMASLGAVDEPEGFKSPYAGLMNPDKLEDIED